MRRTLSTSQFAQALGISESSARRMADSGELEIQRTAGGHRRIYTEDALRYVRESGVKLARPDLLGLVGTSGDIDTNSDGQRLLAALEQGHSGAVTSIIQAMFAQGATIAEICDGPVRNAMVSIGNQWPTEKRAIFIEHRATLLCARALHQLRLSIPEPRENAPAAIGGSPLGDYYLLPNLMVALSLHSLGFRETTLGPNTPLEVIAEAVRDDSPAIVWLSISTPFHDRHQHQEILRLAETTTSENCTFIIGGRYADQVEIPEGLSIIPCRTIGEMERIAEKMLVQE